MFYFENDYCEGAHPAILQKLMETNFEKVSGYGTDPYCASAREKIRAACACPEADVTFISGGTQTNAIVIASMLHRWEGVVAASTGHVNGHEAGAIEYTGHKVLGLPHKNGKLDAATSATSAPPSTQTQPRPHGLPRHGVHLPPHRVRHPLHQSRAAGAARRLPDVPHAPLRGRCPPGLRSGGRGYGRHPARPGPAGGCLLHRRHQGGCSAARPSSSPMGHRHIS